MSTEANKDVIRRYMDTRNKRHFAALDDFIAPDYDVNDLNLPAGPAGFKAMEERTRSTFPDYHFTIDELIAEGDNVVSRWTTRDTDRGQ